MLIHTGCPSQLASLREEAFRHLHGISDAKEKSDAAYAYWDLAIRYRIGQRDIEGGWHLTRAAALGEDVFTGPSRACKAVLEGEPVGLIASVPAVMGFVQVLYYALTHAPGLSVNLSDFDRDEASPWGQLFKSGMRVSKLLEQESGLAYQIAALQALAIANWADNHKRYAAAA